MVSEKTGLVRNVAIRVDSSIQIGSGHVMRCLTLAEGLREQGAEVLFVCREVSGNLNALIAAKGFDLCRLPAPGSHVSGLDWNRHADWLGVDCQQDADETLQYLKKVDTSFDWLIVDHYALDRQWEVLMQPVAGKIMVIDDLADREHDCDLILDQNYYLQQGDKYQSLIPQKCIKLLGPNYALLRPEFHAARKRMKPRSGPVNNILVFFGGVDATNETTKAIKAITSLERDDLTVDVIVGARNLHQEEIRTLCQNHENIRFHCQVDNMAEMMATADLAIGAGGTATWERLCLGLPTLVISLADNQTTIAEDCGRSGVQVYLGASSDVRVSDLTAALRTVLGSPPLLMSIADHAINTVDGKGLSRVVSQMFPLNINLREAEHADCRNIYDWRNAEETRRHIFDNEIIPYETHQQWFESSLQNKDRVILIGESDDKPVGVLRYDFTGQSALISVYLVPGPQPAGAGSQLIRAGSNWLERNHPKIQKIHAEILGENIASIKAFEKAGYHLGHLTYFKELSHE